MLTIKELARVLRISSSTVRRRIQSGDIAALKVGNQYRIPDDAIEALTYTAKEGKP
jgi:excisionase family DNA binding protein